MKEERKKIMNAIENIMSSRGISSAIVLVLIASLPAVSISQTVASSSSTPSASCIDLEPNGGCVYGLWNATSCVCTCIPPYCVDVDTGACTNPTGCVGRPFGDCTRDVDCPWWNDGAYSCDNGPDVPVGVIIHATLRECCDVHHYGSTACDVNTAGTVEDDTAAAVVVDGTSSAAGGVDDDGNNSTNDDGYETITIKFTVGNLDKGIGMGNMIELKSEMAFVLRRVLSDLSDYVEDLKVTSIEESPNLLTTGGGEGGGDAVSTTTVVSVYYDITVLVYPNVDFGSIIIAGLRDMYPEILDWISEGSSRTYIVCGCVYLNWCYDGEMNDGTFSTCSNPSNTETATWNFQVANIPIELDWENSLQYIVGIFEDAIRKSGMDIVEVRINNVLDVPSPDGGGETFTRVITLDFIFVEEIGADYQSIVTETLTETQNDNLQQIQSYFDTSTTLDLEWCVDDNGAYAVCPEEPQQVVRTGSFLLPIWAITTLAATSVVLCCCVSWCFISYLNQRDAANDRRNIGTYIQRGKKMNNTIPRRRRQPPKRRRAVSRPKPHRRRKRSPRKYYETGSIRRLEYIDPDIKNLEAMPSSELSQGKKTQPKFNDTLHLENMPSFVFDHGNANPPQQQLTVGDRYDDEESYHFDDNRPTQQPFSTVQRKLMLEP
jgi:hypothetical protein